MKEISGKELATLLDQPDARIIDIRSADAYNGWALQGEKRGGHIKNSKSLPIEWTNYMDWIEIVRHKNILPEHKIVIYGYDSELVCVRSWSEYIGEVSGYNYIEKKGRIPGAIFADCGSDAYHMENYRNVDQTTREFSEISDIWNKSGITPDKHLAFYCGTGWRGSEAFFNAWLMGYPRVSVYDGGWFEWSNDPANPYETGVPVVITTKSIKSSC